MALALLGAGVAGYILVSRTDEGVESPEPRTITREGVTFELTPSSPAGATLSDGDPRAVTVYSFEAAHSEQPECSVLSPYARVVEESSDAVVIATFDYQVPAKDGQDTQCLYGSDDESTLYTELRLHLEAPLGSRRLVDKTTGEDIGVLEPAYSPLPAQVPAAFKQTLVNGFTPENGFVALRQYRDDSGRSSLEIRVRSATAWSESGKVLDRADVHGADAVVTQEDYQQCVTWSPRRGLIAQVCSLQTFLSPSELLRIARSIPALD